MRALALIAFLILALSPIDESAADVPEPIATLAKQFQGKSPNEVLALIGKRFGPYHRNTGSGLSIPEWEVFGGVLTFHPLTGPFFYDPRTNKVTGLIPTHNAVRENLLQSYEMTSNADKHGTKYWLGNLEFPTSATYRFTKSGLEVDARNFFITYTTGTVAVTLANGITDETLLESLSGSFPIAQLAFTSSDGKEKATYTIVSSEQERGLSFVGATDVGFILDTSWVNFWK
ncbi:hypothetical protein OPU71_20965 [Niveibacterium sp. 24ML]|uniref:hypothetical protein n=1 Tax=Niveibacterium sp. 24ML TaxID=2985512 RepID=UPI00227057EF|nr:hypothetical protein [Niveibacterium sp. 24ML]MCX9158592.1 hypothetical protein [Niveibacterium sp. 24ML]